jgi:hypothetical protein
MDKNCAETLSKCPKFTLKCVGGWGFAPTQLGELII